MPLSYMYWALVFLYAQDALACNRPFSARMADSIISRAQATVQKREAPSASTYLQVGFFQSSLIRLIDYYHTPEAVCAESDWEKYLQSSTDAITPYLLNSTQDASYPLDRLSTANGLLYQYEEYHTRNALSSLRSLRNSVNLQRRNALGGYWYFNYPNWSYLDGMYSLIPFLLSYTTNFDPTNATVPDDVLQQLDLLWTHCRHDGTGLLVHGYDESKSASWANPVTGGSPIVWGRSLGWYFMALVDGLELSSSFPKSMSRYLLSRLIQLTESVISVADSTTGCWWQVMDQANREGNYIESSGSAMFTTALFRAARLGYLPDDLASDARKTADQCYSHLLNAFVVQNDNGTLGYNGTVSVCSLNSSASYEYYISQPLLYNSVHGAAAFVQASLEREIFDDSKDSSRRT
ncbi:hypothetical protein N7468_003209 [Penicillium chermesinum]|uniref:Glycoside hydrolase family 105 protein n=1 Tax=Penicillium chermesinum TaxID=63820 RepID=A0A9W9P6K2_9EURO|nr:uncharacterized protein N7468_003209 [Penicillium chermesinum]KAJ5238590.1 hypothetical protein N7468_003209 [Penicillium chermesinum]KAJ6164242.1 hypothetical protein N7470_002914 [Penicillium chermesinum]